MTGIWKRPLFWEKQCKPSPMPPPAGAVSDHVGDLFVRVDRLERIMNNLVDMMNLHSEAVEAMSHELDLLHERLDGVPSGDLPPSENV